MNKMKTMMITIVCLLLVGTAVFFSIKPKDAETTILSNTSDNPETTPEFTTAVNQETDTAMTTSETEETTTEITTSENQETITDMTTSENQESTTDITTSENQESTSDTITIAMTGDILLSDKLYSRYNEGGLTGFLSPAVKDTLYNADLTFINQEFPFSDRGTPEPGKEYTYCVPTSYVKIFEELDIDVVSISNNHILDYGQDALADTFTTLEAAGIDYVGGGRNLERAKQLITKEVKGKTIGFLAASRVVPSMEWYATNSRAGVFTTYDDKALCEEIRKANELCDVVIVYAHWGIERETVACDYQRTMAKHYIDAGADFVFGSHPHVMQGVEYYNGVPIVYSLGNFLFSNYYSRTTVLTLTIDGNNQCSIDFLPCGSQTYYTYDCDEAGIQEFYSFLNDVSFDYTFSES